MNQESFQYYFESMPNNSIFMEYIIFPLIIFLVVLLIYHFFKQRIMKDDKDELESLKLLQELLEKGTINEDEFEKKKNKIISKW
jgi:Predicted membrane protein|tara:strand:- start:260 stop:511 length:252 start_codon:yes stop_codon:yes gene_type:complete